MKLDANVIRSIEESVLCWLATSSASGQPSVSPKEVFAAFNNDSIIIANIASPNSARNIRENSRACVSFVNVFTQKGFQIKGTALYLTKGDDDFAEIEQVLLNITQGKFPFKSVFRVMAEEVNEILAPRYRLYPETTEQDQIDSAMVAYGVGLRDN
ncbi:MAG: pyridoxamine 5'-phosphate oxidase family protein [Phycisphaeraceae bacterium]|nr:pyridoxamine 5'-phosphate oxidase family protein [Phycisphaerales bacterium]MCB9860380.1 pyridoxamine 5'-phosphate oxidase family protein [Phycisphaeraceae bacterium]